MNPKISVIIPVYNVEPFLRRCLGSITGQSMNEIEIIIIDDGSTDHSGSICDEYAENDSRIRVIHQENGGLSHARNVGIEHATGKYIMFVDSDDYVDANFCKIPYETATANNADIVLFNHRLINNKKLENEAKLYKKKGFVDKQEAIKISLLFNTVSVCNKLFKKELFNKIKFPEGYLFEDNATTYKLILEAETIYYIKDVLYNYCYREDSLCRNKNSKRKTDYIEMYSLMYDELTSKGYECYINNNILVISLRYLTYFGDKGMYSDRCAKYVENFKDYKTSNLETKVLLFIYKHNKQLFNFICYLFNKRQKPENF